MHMPCLQKVCSVVKKALADLPLSCGEVPGAKNLGQDNVVNSDHVSELTDSCQLLSVANCGSDQTEPDPNRGSALTSAGSCNYDTRCFR